MAAFQHLQPCSPKGPWSGSWPRSPDSSQCSPRERDARRRTVEQWQERPWPAHLCAVVRHSERADSYDGFVDGTLWTQTEDFETWPLDCPLSDAGRQEAQILGSKLHDFSEAQGAPFHVVVCSPYYRCIQTAVEICKRLGDDCRLIVDREIGEVFGPAVLGPNHPRHHLRLRETGFDYCKQNGVNCQRKPLGQQPTWPEDLQDARRRYVNRFLHFLGRSVMARQNFVLVSHAECVAATLSIMPSHVDQRVVKVDNGGCFLAVRQPLIAEDAGIFESRANCATLCEEDSSLRDTHVVQVPIDSISSDREGGDPLSGPEMEGSNSAWKVETHNVVLRRKVDSQSKIKVVRALSANTSFSAAYIEQLLGEMPTLPTTPVSSSSQLCKDIESGADDDDDGELSICSLSTLLFGSGDIANIDELAVFERMCSLEANENYYENVTSHFTIEIKDWEGPDSGIRSPSTAATHRSPSNSDFSLRKLSDDTDTSEGSSLLLRRRSKSSLSLVNESVSVVS
eukprot:gnl/TRDRNA2_/TRDRNA2_172401_c0_seq3.p1 gnl/TRDRNA2_/TRDRNA2_172401_c0~~gnl/TRDRNA2_/TRDRNA2_172401_c0_seq3.p1  ORF type:complete len:511 (+),score=44.92 gnl/TRDRNA2_/TRDRNA2_172401_c0_seq3:59-1591(+)